MTTTWTTNPGADDTVLLYPLRPRPQRGRLALLLSRHPGRHRKGARP